MMGNVLNGGSPMLLTNFPRGTILCLLFLFCVTCDRKNQAALIEPPKTIVDAKVKTEGINEAHIISFVDAFEKFQKEHNAKEILALFTPAESPIDKEDYISLSGQDNDNSPRLYNNVSTSFRLKKYKMIGSSTTLEKGRFDVFVQETRITSGGPAYPNRSYTITALYKLILLSKDGRLKVDQYLDMNKKIKVKKFAGFLEEFR